MPISVICFDAVRGKSDTPAWHGVLYRDGRIDSVPRNNYRFKEESVDVGHSLPPSLSDMLVMLPDVSRRPTRVAPEVALSRGRRMCRRSRVGVPLQLDLTGPLRYGQIRPPITSGAERWSQCGGRSVGHDFVREQAIYYFVIKLATTKSCDDVSSTAACGHVEGVHLDSEP
ncbi:hypothetical protein EYF80_051706 [Liparis tanakae]|uniref:Uncharacterized protein n=1 Tax=Liparis tanakae TaxID=230148 RepID=A0A4Z2FA53_9TELE|nr:hypothetical protein EYF80_051706 [Liparis tanakae]